MIPNSLRLFLDELGTKEPGKSAIAHDIIASVTNKITPKQVLLGTAVRHLTGSKQVIEQLNKLGHSCSYTELLRLETAAAVNEINLAVDHGVVIPSNIRPASHGFIQTATDDDDFLEDTVDGKNTTHGATMILIQEGSIGAEMKTIIKTRERSLSTDSYRQLQKIKFI